MLYMASKLLIKNLGVMITKHGNRFVAYSPALDLATCAKSVKGAKKNFIEAANLFLEEIFESGKADDVLSELGWNKVHKKWSPPKTVSSTSLGIKIPAFA